MVRDYTLDNHYQNSCERANTCADSESFVRGGPSMTFFFFFCCFLAVDEERRVVPNNTKRGSSSVHFNGVSLAGR